MLNHTYGPRVTQGYDAYGYDKEKRLALMKWERSLRAIVDGKASGVTKVVRLAKWGVTSRHRFWELADRRSPPDQ